MGVFTFIVNTTSITEKTLRNILRKAMPNRFRQYSTNDFPNLKGCGIVLCRGTVFLRPFTKYTHVALFYYGKIYESTDGVGVHCTSVDQFLSEYLHIYNTIDVYRFERDIDIYRLKIYFNYLNGKPYEQNGIEFVKAGLHLNHVEDDTSFFCSEFVVRILQHLGLVSETILANNYRPGDIPHIELIGNRLIKVS